MAAKAAKFLKKKFFFLIKGQIFVKLGSKWENPFTRIKAQFLFEKQKKKLSSNRISF